MEKLNVAIVGATGAVGEAMRRILDERAFPAGDIRLLASARSAGRRFTVGGRSRTVEVLDDFDFHDTQIALFSTGGGISAEHAPRAAAAGAIVIDNTSVFRLKPHIPLVVPEVNGHRIADGIGPNIIAIPNCVAIPLTVALKPIYDAVGVERVNVATYQSVSGAGASGVRELRDQTERAVRGEPIDAQTVDVRHESVGAAWLKPYFDVDVTQPIALHVAAKRYLCTREPDYLANLSRGSVASLALQGGLMSEVEAEAFEADPAHGHAVALRRWDEYGKIPGLQVPRFERYRPLLRDLMRV